MKATLHGSLHLSDATGEKPRAVPIESGSGCNLWLGSFCVTAANADLFDQLAEAAARAAQIQRAADQRDPKTVCECCRSTLVDGECTRCSWRRR